MGVIVVLLITVLDTYTLYVETGKRTDKLYAPKFVEGTGTFVTLNVKLADEAGVANMTAFALVV